MTHHQVNRRQKANINSHEIYQFFVWNCSPIRSFSLFRENSSLLHKLEDEPLSISKKEVETALFMNAMLLDIIHTILFRFSENTLSFLFKSGFIIVCPIPSQTLQHDVRRITLGGLPLSLIITCSSTVPVPSHFSQI